MANKLIGLAANLINQNQQQNVQPQIDPTLLRFLQEEGALAARFAESQGSGITGKAGSTMAAARGGFNQYGALLSANQTANQVAQANIQQAQQGLQAQNVGTQLQSQQGTAAGLQSDTTTPSTSTPA